jgi:hypothetical protein
VICGFELCVCAQWVVVLRQADSKSAENYLNLNKEDLNTPEI